MSQAIYGHHQPLCCGLNSTYWAAFTGKLHQKHSRPSERDRSPANPRWTTNTSAGNPTTQYGSCPRLSITGGVQIGGLPTTMQLHQAHLASWLAYVTMTHLEPDIKNAWTFGSPPLQHCWNQGALAMALHFLRMWWTLTSATLSYQTRRQGPITLPSPRTVHNVGDLGGWHQTRKDPIWKHL